MNNLYWSIYKNLEREVNNLAELVHFSDGQLSVYSIRIADLLVRTAVEIESLIKELHKDAFGTYLTSTGQMLIALNNSWQLDKKRVSIVSANMHFTDNYSSFCPFKYSKSDGNDYYAAYNAVKHDRSSSFEKKANIHFLLRAMAALYILNVYFQKKDMIPLRKDHTLKDASFGSDIFSVDVSFRLVETSIKEVKQNTDNAKSMYIIRANHKQYRQYQKEILNAFNSQRKLMSEATSNGNLNKRKFGTNFYELAKTLIADEAELALLIRKLADIEAKPNTSRNNLTYEAILNKGQTIYPEYKEE